MTSSGLDVNLERELGWAMADISEDILAEGGIPPESKELREYLVSYVERPEVVARKAPEKVSILTVIKRTIWLLNPTKIISFLRKKRKTAQAFLVQIRLTSRPNLSFSALNHFIRAKER